MMPEPEQLEQQVWGVASSAEDPFMRYFERLRKFVARTYASGPPPRPQ